MIRLRAARIRSIYDSRGQPTVEVELESNPGHVAKAGAPSGASTGAHEVRAFPEGGVPTATERFGNEVAPRLLARPLEDQAALDRTLHEIDGTSNFSRIGGNTATATSVAFALLGAEEAGQALWQVISGKHEAPVRFPSIVGNCLNGGRHAIGGPEFQEFIAYSTSDRPADSIRAALAVHRVVGDKLHKKLPDAALGRGDEGGWVARLGSADALALVAEACAEVRDREKLPVVPGVDLAASEFFAEGKYRYRDKTLDAEGQVAFVAELVDRYGLGYVEDPLDEESFDDFAELTRQVGDRTLVVGDDLYTTSLPRLRHGIALRSSNAVLIKVNQVGTLTDTIETVRAANEAGLRTVTSHRSGEVPEGWLAHLAIGFGSAAIKCGLLGGERVAKLNELLRVAAPRGATG